MNLYNDNLLQTWSENDPFTKERYEQFCRYIKDGQTVLDIGCNTGRGGIVMKDRFPSLKIYGVELLRERIEKIPNTVYELVFNDSIITTNCNNIKFDVIVAGEVIEHIPKTLFANMLHNCKHLLNENGQILFTTPNPNSFLVKLGRDSVFKDPSHVNIMTIQNFKNRIESSGLSIKSIKGSGKSSRYLGYSFPLSFYGSYLSVINK